MRGSEEASSGDRRRKRRRQILSCVACHRQKVKCDRELPCRRCIAGGRAKECHYGSQASGIDSTPLRNGGQEISGGLPIGKAQPQLSRLSQATSYRKGRAVFFGWTHWARICSLVHVPINRFSCNGLISLVRRCSTEAIWAAQSA
jgi:hypothetical protein